MAVDALMAGSDTYVPLAAVADSLEPTSPASVHMNTIIIFTAMVSNIPDTTFDGGC